MNIMHRLVDLVQTIIDRLEISTSQPELVRAQAKALRRQLPLLYLILGVNSVILAHSFAHRAPDYLVLYLPLIFCAFCGFRVSRWIVTRAPDDFSIDDAVRRLRRTVWIALALGFLCSGWALSLYQYGEPFSRAHIEFYMSITVIGCIFCLMHLPAAAMALTFAVLAPFLAFFLMTGQPVLISMAINAAIVFADMIFILLTYYRDFDSLISSKRDLTLKRLETERLSFDNARLANTDNLTNLPNRRSFFEELELRREHAAVSGARFAVALFDLDGFKPVNDVYGHAAGDHVLVEAARRLARHSAGSTVARLGGDEFGILIDSAPNEQALMEIVGDICAALSEPYALRSGTARLSGSIGLAVFNEATLSSDELMERADYALYHAKKHCPGTPVIFSRSLDSELKQASAVGQALRDADLERELSVKFQPIVDSFTRHTIGFEALARWNSPEVGCIPPSVFIPRAERIGIVSRLTNILLRKALREAASWALPLRVSVNLSTRDLVSTEAMAAIIQAVKASDVCPSRIDFEVTETAVMSDFDKASQALLALRDLGCGISLDDFGTGHSSLSYVHRLPLDKVKIDRSFVDEIEHDTTARAIVKTIVDMCRNLQLECIVEGVESEEQIVRLRQLGCRVMQGFIFSYPLAANDVADYLDAEIAQIELEFQAASERRRQQV